jgi:hypothetical protein
MGNTIEQIRIGKTRGSLRAQSSTIRFGPDPLITIPACGFWSAAKRGLTEVRTRLHRNTVKISCIVGGNHRRESYLEKWRSF